MLRLDFDTSSAEAWLDGLVTDANDAIRPAAQAGAQVLYDEVLLRVPVGQPHVGKGGKMYSGGLLRSAVYQAFSADNSFKDRAVYHVSWNARKAPHGHLIEYGHWQPYRVVKTAAGRFITLRAEPLPQPVWVPAQPFVRPAFDARYQAALQAAGAEWVRRMGGAK